MLSSARDGTFSRPPSCENLLATSCWHFCMKWFARIASTPIPFLPLPRAREGGGRQGALPEVRVDLSSRNRSRRVGERERPCPLRLCTAFDDVKQIQNLPIPPKLELKNGFGGGHSTDLASPETPGTQDVGLLAGCQDGCAAVKPQAYSSLLPFPSLRRRRFKFFTAVEPFGPASAIKKEGGSESGGRVDDPKKTYMSHRGYMQRI